jgi:hypothetical protein
MEGDDPINNRYHLIQHQFHANLPLRLARGWQIVPAVSMLNFRDKPLIIGYDDVDYEYLIRQIGYFHHKLYCFTETAQIHAIF